MRFVPVAPEIACALKMTFGQIVQRLFRDVAIAFVFLAVFSLIFALSRRRFPGCVLE